jgi:glucose/mannose-6-phosphate isomerase
VFGHSALVPELNHNEIVSWEKPGHALGRSALIVLRDAEDSPRAARRLDLTAAYARERGARVFEFRAGEGDRLSRMAESAQFGDYVSFYLALLNGVDPTPIASIDAFKKKLAEGAAEAR